MALGARPEDVRRLVVRDGARVAVIGLALGGLAGWWLVRAMSSILYGVSMREASVWFTVVTVIALTTLLASWRPAARAGKADPAALLRET
jgi:ABC-type lipoprotein release transport system permease subunit